MNQLAENRLPGALVIPALGILLGLAPRTPPALALPPQSGIGRTGEAALLENRPRREVPAAGGRNALRPLRRYLRAERARSYHRGLL